MGVPGSMPLTAAQQQQILSMRGFAAGMPGGMPHMMVPGAGPSGVNMAALQALMQAQAQQQMARAQAAAAAQAEQKRKLETGAEGPPGAKQQRTIPQQDGPADEGGEEGGEEEEGAEEGGAAEGAGAEEEEEDDDPLTEDEEGSGELTLAWVSVLVGLEYAQPLLPKLAP